MKQKSVTVVVLMVGWAVMFAGAAYAGALHEAAKDGEAEQVNRLLAAGADVNEIDAMGVSALHWAVHAGNTKTVEALIKRGADVQAVSGFGSTPLHWAAAKGNTTIIRELLAAGAGVNEQNYAGLTSTKVARLAGKSQVRSLLAKEGGRESGAQCRKQAMTSAHGYRGYRISCDLN